MEKFAVLGCGNGGKAVAAELAHNGASVSIFEAIPNEGFRKLEKEKSITLTGTMNFKADIDIVTENLKEAIEGRSVIMVVVPSFAHESMFKLLIPLLSDGQHVVVVPGNYSTFLLKKLMKDMNVSVDITISETASLPYACRATDYHTVDIYKKKEILKVGTYPASKNAKMLSILNEANNMFKGAENVLEVALDNLNFIVHPIPTLLNIAGIESNPSGWRHYIDGISPTISVAVGELDKERLSIGEAFGLKLTPILKALKEYYGDNDCDNVYDFVNSDQSPYKEIYGQDVFGRYVTEDLPYLVVPAKTLATIAGIDTPWVDTVISLGSLVHHKDYIKVGYNQD
ncbi:MAG: NAD/NADP octopine/nopaline dehydrogenase family protein, partial [Clostridiales bacterium]|nr:NAD/NADP octopine/nopaline dehydrogenase family protein [Clostridiales bacterium]